MKTIIVAAVTAMGMTGFAIADEAKGPVVMTDAQMDNITAGAGRDNVAIVPWGALFAAGFVPTHHAAADQGVIDHAGHLGVIVPRRP